MCLFQQPHCDSSSQRRVWIWKGKRFTIKGCSCQHLCYSCRRLKDVKDTVKDVKDTVQYDNRAYDQLEVIHSYARSLSVEQLSDTSSDDTGSKQGVVISYTLYTAQPCVHLTSSVCRRMRLRRLWRRHRLSWTSITATDLQRTLSEPTV